MKLNTLIIFSTLFLYACGGVSKTKLDEGGKNVQIFDGKPYAGCEVQGSVVGENEFGSMAVARNHARNLAAKQGGNYLEIKDEIMNGKVAKVHALSYLCP